MYTCRDRRQGKSRAGEDRAFSPLLIYMYIAARLRSSVTPAAAQLAQITAVNNLAQRRCLATAPETTAAAIQRLLGVMQEAAESCHDTFNPEIDANGHLIVDLGDKGTYSMQDDRGRLLLFSPVSGPCHYEFDAGNRWWSAPDDGHLLDEKLVREMMHITSVYLNL